MEDMKPSASFRLIAKKSGKEVLVLGDIRKSLELLKKTPEGSEVLQKDEETATRVPGRDPEWGTSAIKNVEPGLKSGTYGQENGRSDERREARQAGAEIPQMADGQDPSPAGEAGEGEGGQSSRSSTSSTESLESVISVALSSESAESSSIDEGPSAFSLKWGNLLDEILAEQSAPRQRSQAVLELSKKQPTSWGFSLDPVTIAEAEAVLRKYTDVNVCDRSERHEVVPELDEDLERGEYVLGKRVIDPAQCRVYGPGLQERIAGVLSEFFIQAVTADGSYLPHGGSRFVVYIQRVEDPHRGEEGSLLPGLDPQCRDTEAGIDGSQQSLAQVFDNEDGTYTVLFSCPVAVRYQVTILLDDKYPVASSPYTVSVVPGRIDASQTVAYGNSLKYYERNGEVNDFVIQARDSYGNNIKQGGDKFFIEGLGAINIIETLDFNDGLYRVKFFVRPGSENQYCQLSIRYDGQHIQGSPFYPKPIAEPNPHPPPKKVPNAYAATYLVNPSKSLIGAMSTFSSCMEQTAGPKLPTFPPFPSQTETHDIVRKLLDPLKPVNLDVCTMQLSDVRKQLRECLHGLIKKEEDLENMLGCIKRHASAGAVHTNIGEGSKDELSKLIDSVAQIQGQLHTTYKSLQHRVVDSLPVNFELEDPDEIRKVHKEKRAQLLQAHKQLEAKERELRTREQQVKTQISSYMSQLAADLKAREHALEMEQRALKTNTRQVLKMTSSRLKKHVRREALFACEREPVEAKKSEFWQRDFHRFLVETPIVSSSPKAPQKAASRYDTAVAPAEETRQVKTRPEDPNSIAFWIVEKQFLSGHKQQLIRSPERVVTEEGEVYPKNNIRRSNPSRVTCMESRARDT